MAMDPKKSVKIISLVLAASLITPMIGCASNTEKPEENANTNIEAVEPSENTVDKKATELDNIINEAQNSNQSGNLTEEEKDEIAEKVFSDIKNSTADVLNETKESGKKLTDKAKDSLKKATIYSYRFTHNEVSAHGVYFKDLTSGGKEIVYSVIDEIKLIISAVAPELPSWLSEKKDEIEKWLGDDNVDSLKSIKDNAKEVGNNMIDRADKYWEEKSNEYSR